MINPYLNFWSFFLRFHTEPIRREQGHFNVKTNSHFVEPGFISVYAYGCEPRLKREFRQEDEEQDDGLSREMEDIFLKGEITEIYRT